MPCARRGSRAGRSTARSAVELGAPVGGERPGGVILGVRARSLSAEHVVGREQDHARAARGHVGRAGGVHREGGAGSRSQPSTSVIAAACTTTSPDRSAARTASPIAHVEAGTVEEDRVRQVGAEGGADLPARARYENAGIRSHCRAGFWASRSLSRGGASSCQSMARVGSSQATPCSSAGSYSLRDPVDQVDLGQREVSVGDAGRDVDRGRRLAVEHERVRGRGGNGPAQIRHRHPGAARDDVPQVGLMAVVVEPAQTRQPPTGSGSTGPSPRGRPSCGTPRRSGRAGRRAPGAARCGRRRSGLRASQSAYSRSASGTSVLHHSAWSRYQATVSATARSRVWVALHPSAAMRSTQTA